MAGGVVAVALTACGSVLRPKPLATATSPPAPTTPTTSTAAAPPPRPRPNSEPEPKPPYRIGERTLTFLDASRRRRIVTVIRYPKAPGRFPLIVFGHGFAVTPAPYSALLRAWARAGFVVAAPVFPRANAHALGGPDERDLVNQPRDMSFVITQVDELDHARSGFLARRVNSSRIAVSGQSDGGDTALASAYDPRYRDRRIRAAMILSGAEIPYLSPIQFSAPSPPLLATQGTADTINVPSSTYMFFDAAPPPKYLVKLLGAPHLPPYTYMEPQLGIVERVTIDFLEHFLERRRGALRRMVAAASVPGTASITAEPAVR